MARPWKCTAAHAENPHLASPRRDIVIVDDFIAFHLAVV